MKRVELERTLQYDETRWEEVPARVSNTLQLFITNKCNLRCKACFYAENLGKEDMPMDTYKEHVLKYKSRIQKVILLGGEPTLHRDLEQMIYFNNSQGLRTTIYTNGVKLSRLEGFDLSNVEIRVGVYGLKSSEKPLEKIPKVNFPITLVYMLRKDNVHELMPTAEMADSYNCKRFFISSIRDIADTGNYWDDNEDTLPLKEYADVVQDFVNNYKGNMELNLSKRGVLNGKKEPMPDKCRFGNIFPDGSKVICPFDIAVKKYADELCFNERQCNKNTHCLLMKIVLKPIPENLRKYSPELRKYMEFLEESSREVSKWPAWRRAGIVPMYDEKE